MAWHGLGPPNMPGNVGPNGYTCFAPGAGEDIDIPANATVSVGYVYLFPNMRHDVMFGDRLWFSYNGRSAGGLPRVHVYTNYPSNRNFGAPNTLRRSNAASVGYMDHKLYSSFFNTRTGWDRAGPRQGQHFQRRINVKSLGHPPSHGYHVQSPWVPVVAYWN